MADILALEGVSAGYGESMVLEDVSLAVNEGESVALLGRNGVGKTTLIATVMGLTRLHGGAVRWRGADISRMPVHERARAGIGWVPQERRMWASLTVDEHLTSGGEQQMLAIARALVTNPALLLLDEPMEGLAPIVVRELAEVLAVLSGSGDLSLILVEQHAEAALEITGRAVVMERGRIVHQSASDELLADRGTLDRWLAASGA